MNIFFIYMYENTFAISTAQTDTGSRSRTFSLKKNELLTFCEITQMWHYLKSVFIYLDELTN